MTAKLSRNTLPLFQNFDRKAKWVGKNWTGVLKSVPKKHKINDMKYVTRCHTLWRKKFKMWKKFDGVRNYGLIW